MGATCLPPTQQKEGGGPGSRDAQEPPTPTPGGQAPAQEYDHPVPPSGWLSNHALPPGYREGFLWKRGRDNGQFLSRKFVLTEREGALKYFNRSDVSGFGGRPSTLSWETHCSPVGTLHPLLVAATPSGVGDAGGTPRPSRDRELPP